MRTESGDPDIGSRWLRSILTYFKSELGSGFSNEKDSIMEYDNIPGIHKGVPLHIDSFIEQSRKGTRDLWENEFAHEFEGVNALLVYDFGS